MEIAFLKDNLNSMQFVLSELKESIDREEQDILMKENRKECIRNKIKDIIKLQDKDATVLFNIGEVEYRIAKKTIDNCYYYTKLRELILLNEGHNEVITINRNKHYFDVILRIMRTDLTNPDYDREINIVNRELTVKGMIQELKYYFPDVSLKTILIDFKIRINNSIVYVEGTNKIVYLSKFIRDPIENKPISKYLIKNISEINTKNKTFYVLKNKNLKLKFAQPILIKEIKLCPFWEDIECCFPGDGANEVVYGYFSKLNLKYLGVIPSNYGMNSEDSYWIKFKPILVKGIIFMPRYHDLSIANIYIN